MTTKKYDEYESQVIANHLTARGEKADAVTSGIWTAQELHKIKSVAYEKDYPAGSALKLLPL